mmetsp:Transcript_11186/g.12621  ORF Transcript_11186/g.12621 Transcript_11186/m.12621 type:complete len:190 (-) Transcript_11186:1029-1598(-)
MNTNRPKMTQLKIRLWTMKIEWSKVLSLRDHSKPTKIVKTLFMKNKYVLFGTGGAVVIVAGILLYVKAKNSLKFRPKWLKRIWKPKLKEVHTLLDNMFKDPNNDQVDKEEIKEIYEVILQNTFDQLEVDAKDEKFKEEFPEEKLDKIKKETKELISEGLNDLIKKTNKSSNKNSLGHRTIPHRNPYCRF